MSYYTLTPHTPAGGGPAVWKKQQLRILTALCMAVASSLSILDLVLICKK